MKKSSMKISVLLVMVMFFSTAFVAWATGGGEATDSAQDGVEITWVGHTEEQTSETQTAAYKQIIQNYEAISGNTVNLELVPMAQYRTWLTSNFVAGTAPEVIQSKLAWAWEDYNKGYLVELNDYMTEESPYIEGRSWKDTFSPVLYGQVIDPANDVVSLAPTMVVLVRMFYNKDIFEQVGIEELPTTWAEFLEISQTIQNAGIVPFAFANSKPTDYHMLWTNMSIMGQTAWAEAEELDLSGDGFTRVNEVARGVISGSIDFQNDPYRSQFEIISDWSQYWNRDFNGLDNASASQMFIRGDAAMTFMASTELQRLNELEGLDFEFAAFPIPTITEETYHNALGKSVVLGGIANNGYVVNAAAEGAKLDAAVEFVQYLTSAEAANIRARELYSLPTLVGVDIDSLPEGFELTDAEEIVRCNLYGPATSPAFFEFYQRTGQLFLSGDMDYAEYADRMNDEMSMLMELAAATNGWTEENAYGTDQ